MKRTDPYASPSHSEHLISTNGRFAERVWHPDVPLFESVHNELMMACISNSDEICGLISTDQELFYIENVHDEPSHNFFMSQEEYKMAVHEIFDNQAEILGVFHTHPNATPWPTPRDLNGWPPFEMNWRYWIVTNKEVIEWRLA